MPLSPRQASRLAEHILDDQVSDGPEGAPGGVRRDESPAGPLPQRIGRCLIRRLIAAGGMGVVYEAEQENPRRVVAVKVMSRQFAARGRAALRRFEYEAQILARLDHPGIAKIHEAGTWDDGTGGVPYFVMEFIPEARNIIEFAEAKGLGHRDRLTLFAKICDAVDHGHQKGIIHRDLKPSNIMVQEAAVGDVLQPKVIDFGVARAADTDISVTTMHTRPGDIVGTLQYMSPEQCDGDPHAIDVRSDVYSLGVVLYELLCGRLPYDLANTPIPRAARIVQEQEPDRPSLIVPIVRMNLEAIILKAVAKSSADRYQSAADFARDIRRFLAGEPVEARQPGIGTRLIRTVARHPVLSTAAACLTIIILTIGSTLTALWYLNARPHHVELMAGDQKARLVSFGGRTLHTWTSTGRMRSAELVRPAGAGPLVVLGFHHDQEGPWQGALCAFDSTSDPEAPVWVRRITTDDLPAVIQSGKYNVAGFGVDWAASEDIFPQIPGPELVVGYSHTPYSPFALAIFGTDGRLLYRVWHDGGTRRGYWMGGARQLVLAGQNSEVYWERRGVAVADVQHPTVVFSLEPRLGYIGENWTTPTPGGDMTTVAWYRCLLPPQVAARVPRLMRPAPGHDPSRFVTLDLRLSDEKYSVTWTLDADGQEVPGTRIPNDRWRIDKPFPVDYFELGDLPPIVPATPEN